MEINKLKVVIICCLMYFGKTPMFRTEHLWDTDSNNYYLRFLNYYYLDFCSF